MRAIPLLFLLLAACRATGLDALFEGEAGPRARSDDRTLIIGKPGDVIALDPAVVTDNESVEVIEQLFERLVRYRPGTREIEPALATHWEVFEHQTLWIFHLRDGVRFHDGTPVDAAAVVFSFERQRNPFHPFHEPASAYWRDQYGYIEKIEAVDRLTVRIKIERPFAPFLSSLAMFPASIVSPAAVERWGSDFGRHPVGSGPFRFQSWVPEDRVILERFPGYWGQKPRLDRVVFRAIADARQRLVAVEGGTIDVAYAVLPEELQYVALHPDLRIHVADAENVAYVAMNNAKPPWNDLRVRRAVNHAVNKEPIVKLVYQGLAVPAVGPLPPTTWSYRGDVTRYPYDPLAARALLAQAAAEGRFDAKQRYTLYAPRTPRAYVPDPEQMARVVQRNLADVGIQVDLVVQDFGPHQAAVHAGLHDLALHGWTSDNGDPDNILHVLLDRDDVPQGPEHNIAFYRNAEVHGLLRYAEESLDKQERTGFYRRVQAIIADEAPWVPLAHSQSAVVARRDVQDLSVQPTGSVPYWLTWLDR
jgi:peptide/nickel transport system substrate-binding protein